MKKIFLICFMSIFGCLSVFAQDDIVIDFPTKKKLYQEKTYSQAFTNNYKTFVQGGMELPLLITEEMSSKSAMGGDYIDAKLSKDIFIKDILVFKKNEKAKIKLSLVEREKMLGIPGKIVLGDGKIHDINGNIHKISVNREFKGAAKKWSKICCGFGIVVWPLLLFGLVKGNPGEINTNTLIEAELVTGFNL